MSADSGEVAPIVVGYSLAVGSGFCQIEMSGSGYRVRHDAGVPDDERTRAGSGGVDAAAARATHQALWWVPAGHRPPLREAEERLAHPREHGPTPFAFAFKQPLPPPGASAKAEPRSDACP